MPYVEVPRDLSTVKNKIAMGLTKRQLLSILAAGVLCLPVYFLFQSLGKLAIYIAVLPAIPCFMVGFYTAKDGRPLEKVLLNYIEAQYRRPRRRPYQTKNIYTQLAWQAQITEVINSESQSGNNVNDTEWCD